MPDKILETELTRRKVFGVLAGLGIGTSALHDAIASQAVKKGDVTPDSIKEAERIAGIELSEADRKEVAGSVKRAMGRYARLRKIALRNAIPPAIAFHPAPWMRPAENSDSEVKPTDTAAPKKPKTEDDLAFLPVTELAALLRNRTVTSMQLTKLYLARLKKYDPALKFVVNLTEELALKQAKQADAEIAAGRYRGPLHGVPWGVKDLFSVPGYPTTWGAPQFKDQKLNETATIVRKLEAAGAVLLAKLSVGALAMGDRWFGGRTNCPWDKRIGSSGSSAGSCSATAAGCVGFAIGTETHGSIVSPCRRNGTTGLRPTFGRVSRHGGMSLSWSMDKVGPIARSVEDCALIFGAIHGFDGKDPSAVDRPFHWPAKRDLSSLKVGYFKSARVPDEKREDLKILRGFGVKLVPIALPKKNPIYELLLILDAEAGTLFDELVRTGNLAGLNSWPRTFRGAQFIPAVEYLRANRIRTLLMREMDEVMEKVDCYIGGRDLTLTNLTGHPTVVMPVGFRKFKGRKIPYSITFTGRLYGESELLAVAHAFQQKQTAHLERPPMGDLLKEDGE